jgi:hypothetical protein
MEKHTHSIFGVEVEAEQVSRKKACSNQNMIPSAPAGLHGVTFYTSGSQPFLFAYSKI